MRPDVIVVGAGVMGSSIAFHLCVRGGQRVLVLDQTGAGAGMSSRSSALVRMHYSFPPEVQLAVKSLDIFRRWSEITGAPGLFRKTGFVRIVPAEQTDRLKKNVAMQRSLGVEVQLLSAQELAEIEPDWRVDDVVAAAYEPESGYGDGAGVATDFLAAARRRGADYRAGARALGLVVSGGAVRGVETAAGTLEAAKVVVATGPWTRPLLAAVGVDVPIETEYHQVGFLKPPAWKKWPTAACIDSITKVYTRSEVGGCLLVGDFYGRRGVDPDDFPQTASSEALLDLAERASRRIPILEDARIGRGVTGVYDQTPDARPLLGEAPAVEGLYVAAGFCGMGFKISPAVGLCMAELIADGASRTVDLTPFRPDRFARGRPIRAEFEYQDD
jgi:glycine/D-amino acid oxidase-like deaminating enzyme